MESKPQLKSSGLRLHACAQNSHVVDQDRFSVEVEIFSVDELQQNAIDDIDVVKDVDQRSLTFLNGVVDITRPNHFEVDILATVALHKGLGASAAAIKFF